MKKRRISLRIDPSDLALEVVSIVLAIILATAVGQAVSNYRAAERSRDDLAQIRQEIAHDDAALRAVRPLHRRVADAFALTLHRALGRQLDFNGFTETFVGAAPTGFHPFGGTTTAWDLTRNSSVLEDEPYSLRAKLQTRYAELAQLRDLDAALYARLLVTPTDGHPNFYYAAVAISSTLSDLVASESRLLDDDDEALQTLHS